MPLINDILGWFGAGLDLNDKPSYGLDYLDVAKCFAENYTDFHRLRVSLMHSDQHANLHCADALVKLLLEKKWINKNNKRRQYVFSAAIHPNDELFVRGAWLEFYVASALEAAGADEVVWGQKIIWGHSDHPSTFELDVIARKKEKLFFVTCKTVAPGPDKGLCTKLRRFMDEANTWDQLFSGGKAGVIVATTFDFIDENNNSHRYPNINQQAEVLDQTLIGLEDLVWEKLVEKCRYVINAQ